VFDYSIKRQQIAAKKVFPIDTGLANAVGFTFSANTGKLLENVAFLALRRKTNEVFYYTTPAGYEVDFYLPESRQLIQVAQSLSNPATREREVRTLVDAMRSLNLSQGVILSDANAESVKENGFTITMRSVAEWLLESS
jgi:predicted AAA+ superfamily ATPase